MIWKASVVPAFSKTECQLDQVGSGDDLQELGRLQKSDLLSIKSQAEKVSQYTGKSHNLTQLASDAAAHSILSFEAVPVCW